MNFVNCILLKPATLGVAFIALSLPSCGLLEQVAWELLTAHTPGRQYCASEVKTHRFQHHQWVEVPADYSKPEQRWTEIYTWTWEPFDPEKPSVIVFEGGPGGSSHSGHLELPDFNVIYFDQRGVACSQAPTRALHEDITYYSSENTARDAEELRKHYGVDEWSAYGSSYGTVPATIYGHLFPEATRAVLLEGVIFAGDQDLWASGYTRRVLQRYFDSLSPQRQSFIIQVSHRDPYFFSDLIMPLMFQDNFQEVFEAHLDELMAKVGAAAGEDFRVENDESEFEVQAEMSYQAYRAIFCRELGGTEAGSGQLIFRGQNLVYSNKRRHQMSRICRGVNLGEGQEHKLSYRALDYPLSVPVVYFQGARDGATAADAAVRHYKHVPGAMRQIFIMPGGGHGPSYFRLGQLVDARTGEMEPYPGVDSNIRQLQRQIFSQAALGLLVQPELIVEFNRLSPVNPWAYGIRD